MHIIRSQNHLNEAPVGRHTCLSRRTLLGASAVLGIGALASKRLSLGQIDNNPRRIDIHHHFTPQVFTDFMKAHNLAGGFGSWTLEADLEDMDKSGTQTAVLSITTPGFGRGPVDDIRKAVRDCNEAAAKLKVAHPGRFGSFAALPLTDVEGSLREIEYALDTLKVEGIGLFSNYGDKWLGHASFAPMYEELNRRKAVVYVHPIAGNCCTNLLPNVPNEAAMIEFGTDTTRTIADLIFSGTTTKYPNIVWIFSHAGGSMPFMIERFLTGATAEIVPGIPTKGLTYAAPQNVPKGVLYELRKMYYDTAQASNPVALDALRKVVPTSQIVYGTDYWYRTSEETARGLTTSKVFNASELRAIARGNAERILPRLRS
jgi:predicted TIM-barrel fold metal-dependent hydrolase